MKSAVWLLGAMACTAPGGPPVVVALDPTGIGSHGALWEDIEPELGARSDGFPGVIQARVHAPQRVDRPAPMVVLLPSSDARTDEWFDTATWLSTWGMVVVVPAFDAPANERTHAGLVEDMAALLGWLQSTALPIGSVETDARKFGLLGHGRGGKIAVLSAAEDGRVGSVLALAPDNSGDGTPAKDWPSALPKAAGKITVPRLVIGAAQNGDGDEACFDPADSYAAFFGAFAAGAVQFELPDASPTDFVDPCASGGGSLACASCPPGADPAEAARFSRAAAVAFFTATLTDQASFDGWLDGTAEGFPEDVVVTTK